MDLLVTVEQFETDIPSQQVWKAIAQSLVDTEGIAYYRYPILRGLINRTPEFTVLSRNWQPFCVRVLGSLLESISAVTDASWTIGAETVDSPLLESEDFVQALLPRFQQQRPLRNMLKPMALVALPNIDRHAFEARFPGAPTALILFRRDVLPPVMRIGEIPEPQWSLAKAVFQSTAFGLPRLPDMRRTAETKGEAMRLLEEDLMLLDEEQHKVAVQLPAGPQSIRGLAGTGKTVLLAMKAANLHLRFPDRPILFTFFTQSLYNAVTRQITRFFVADSGGQEPNWDVLHVRHAWGGRVKAGVYSDICYAHGVSPYTVSMARQIDDVMPLAACAQHALSLKPAATYDYVLVDEAQDLPAKFMRLLVELSRPPHAIYFAYDELQNLSAVKMPDVADLFGRDERGQPLISLEGEYPGGIEKTLVLQKSYRCPGRVLMLAHAIGLGLYARRGCVQILPDAAAWSAVGYEVRQGTFTLRSPTVIERPAENSPNRIERLYTGPVNLIRVRRFETRQEELAWVSGEIIRDIREERLKPEDIVVVTLDPLALKKDLAAIQRMLFEAEVQSVIPGVLGGGAPDDFGNAGMVTLASVYRAKGNEAAAVYVIDAEVIARYGDEIEARNKAFTAISRTKGWLCVTGSGSGMDMVASEIDQITADYPKFRFQYPDPTQVFQLAAESTRRKRALRAAMKSAEELLRVDSAAIAEMGEEKVNALIERLRGAVSDD